MVNAKRGINLAGLEGNYGDNPKSGGDWDRSVGPEVGVNYPLHDPRLVDYYHSKDVGVIRLPFSWDRMQSQLWGAVPDPIPGYALYFSNFKQIVDYATNLGMTVIVEPWQADADGKVGGPTWLGQPVGDSPAHVDRYAFADFWQKLASIFKANPLVECGLVNEPHDMSTMSWWTTAQKCVDYIRAAGATTTIYVPGNGYTAASRWTDPTVDTDSPQRSNAYGWLNVNDGQPLFDPLNKCVAEVHVYMDRDGSGNHDEVASTTIARQNLTPAMNEAAAQGYLMFVGEVAVSADVPGAEAAWADFIDYIEQPPPSAFVGYTWWAGGWPDWWKVTKAPYFSVSPTDTNNFVGDTTNMVMIEKNFH